MTFVEAQLAAADALLLGRRTYEGFAPAYQAMPPGPFVDRMNTIPKYVASKTLRTADWNATIIQGDVSTFVAEHKQRHNKNLVKYGNGSLDLPLLQHNLIDELHLLLAPVATGGGKHLFEELERVRQMQLVDLKRFRSGVVALTYQPAGL